MDDSIDYPEPPLVAHDPSIQETESFIKSFKYSEFVKYSGPAWLMCIAYLDPGNLESDLQSAAMTGNKLIWVLFWSHVLGLFIQNLSSKLGLKSTLGLGSLLKEKYALKTSMCLWFNIELAIIGSDIQEIIGTCIALKILFGIPIFAGVLITSLDTGLFLMLSGFGMRRMEQLFAFFIAVMGVCFLLETIISRPSVGPIIKGLVVPYIPSNAYVQATAMVGSIIMPHNIYLHSALISKKNKHEFNTLNCTINLKKLQTYFKLESFIALTASFLINLCVMIVFAQVFYYKKHDMQQIKDIGLSDAAPALRKTLGGLSSYLWGFGLLAAGQSSTMTGTMAGQLIMEGFFDFKIEAWKRTLITRSVALVPSVIVAYFFTEYLDTLGEYLNVFQSLQLPLTLIPLIKLTNDHKIMHAETNTKNQSVIYQSVIYFVIFINVILVYHMFKNTTGTYLVITMLLAALYMSFCYNLHKNYIL